MTTAATENLAADLRQFTGSETLYRHGMIRRVTYTEGVQYLAEHAGAYWLIDIVAIAQRCCPRVRAEGFQVWTLTRPRKQPSSRCTVTCEDGNGHGVYRQRIPFTDFPLDTVTLYCVKNVIMLTTEY